MKPIGKCLFVALLLLVSQMVGAAEKPIPIRPDILYLNFFYHIEAFTQPDKSAEVTERLIRLFQKHGVQGDFWFTGAVAENLATHHPDVAKLVTDSGMPLGYHGDVHRPHPTPLERVGNLGWDEAVKDCMFWETHHLDVNTGELDPTRPGAWKLMEQIFKRPLPITIGGAGTGIASTIYVHKQLGAKLGMLVSGPMGEESTFYRFVGLPVLAHNSNPARDLKAFLDEQGLKAEEPLPTFERGQNNEVVKYVASLIAQRKTYRPNNVSVMADMRHDWNLYAQQQGWDGPFADEKGLDANFKYLEDLIVFAKNNPNVRIVTCEDLINMIASEKTEFTSAEIESIARQIAQAEGDQLPGFFRVGDDYASLADAFDLLCAANAGKATGKSATALRLRGLLGPTVFAETAKEPISFTAKQVTQHCMELNATLTDRVPAWVIPGKSQTACNAAEWLTAMAKTYLEGGDAEQTVTVPSKKILSPIGEQLANTVTEEAFRRFTMGQSTDNVIKLYQLQAWTYKPACLAGTTKSVS